MSEAEYLYDLHIGDEVMEELESERISEILDDRDRRLNSLVGKYVIVDKGSSSKTIVYLQDRSISKGGWWTNFLSNAIGYVSTSAALAKASSLRYGNPKVHEVIRLPDHRVCTKFISKG